MTLSKKQLKIITILLIIKQKFIPSQQWRNTEKILKVLNLSEDEKIMKKESC